MEFHKLDKNGVASIIKITLDTYLNTTYVKYSIYQAKTNKKWWSLKRLECVYYKSVSLEAVNQFTLNDFETWANKQLSDYNDELTRVENNNRVKTLIENK